MAQLQPNEQPRNKVLASKVTDDEELVMRYLSAQTQISKSDLTRNAVREQYDVDALVEEARNFFAESARNFGHIVRQTA